MVNFQIKLSKIESTRMWLDITKFLTVAVVMHLLLYSIDGYGELFDETALKIFLYLTIGLIIYYLIIRKLVDKYILFKDPIQISDFEPKIEPAPKKNKKKIKKNKNKNIKIKKNKKVTFRE